jgi:hypothetical protein
MKKPLIVTVGKNDIIHISIVSDLLENKTESLAVCIEEATKLISSMHTANNKKVKILVDLSKFTGEYAIKSFTDMINFATDTKPYVEKSAVFSGLEKGRMAAEMVITLSRRDDIKVFNNEEEAMAWLESPKNNHNSQSTKKRAYASFFVQNY